MGEAVLKVAASAIFALTAVLITAGAAAQPVIDAVELRSDVPLRDRERIWQLVTLRPGEPLSERQVGETLRNLVASGETQDVRIYRRPSDDGVTVVIAAWGRIRVTAVRLVGEPGLSEEDLRADRKSVV